MTDDLHRNAPLSDDERLTGLIAAHDQMSACDVRAWTPELARRYREIEAEITELRKKLPHRQDATAAEQLGNARFTEFLNGVFGGNER